MEDFPSCFVGPKLVDIRTSWPIFKFCIIGNETMNLVNNANVATLPLHTSRIHVDSKSWFTGMEESISFTQKGRAFLLMFAAELQTISYTQLLSLASLSLSKPIYHWPNEVMCLLLNIDTLPKSPTVSFRVPLFHGCIFLQVDDSNLRCMDQLHFEWSCRYLVDQ